MSTPENMEAEIDARAAKITTRDLYRLLASGQPPCVEIEEDWTQRMGDLQDALAVVRACDALLLTEIKTEGKLIDAERKAKKGKKKEIPLFDELVARVEALEARLDGEDPPPKVPSLSQCSSCKKTLEPGVHFVSDGMGGRRHGMGSPECKP